MTPAPQPDVSTTAHVDTDPSVRRVTFCMQWIPAYRVEFYEGLASYLAERNIVVKVVHGAPPSSRKQRRDGADLAWGLFRRNTEIRVRGIEATWQRAWAASRGADLIVVQQEAALLFNYVALGQRAFGGPKVAMWGHGEFSDHTRQNRTAERLKRLVTPRADWFFAYTERSAEIARSFGMTADRITVVNNSKAPDRPTDGPPSSELADLVEETRSRGGPVAWMSSALDDSKRLDVVVEIVDRVRSMIPDFEFFVLGRGALEQDLFTAAESRPWLHAVGARFGADKAAIAQLAQITIHPGLLGLHVIDSFQTRTPIVTQQGPWHSHEFDYLNEGNAVVLGEEATAAELAEAAVELLRSPDQLDRLRHGCAMSAKRFSLQSMVENFGRGVLGALDAPRRRTTS